MCMVLRGPPPLPVRRAALIGPLSVIVPLINSLGAVDTKFQVGPCACLKWY